ncbi:hypothetical protein C475_00912 [Halosimplex carlsbadense 2-9-1]|uniref:Archaeal Type IV pilin N-terminal domain-containing protein n=1 Tax=Halosimplex carlsbadense 2-9-1 TaxID=797114 RepID=M0D3Z4_9EURY|nr:type IV pilin [Halosimplex carlsbadense]ELZ30251.1 hypothetical protein C475_00912 [Halosimplex carlsbadense 2-9-1]
MFDTTHSDRSPRGAGLSGAGRAVSPVVGAVLMFALLVLLLSVLQATAIPALNEQTEFRHSERVQSDVVDLAAAVDRTAATGVEQTVRIEAGLRYPVRPLFVNPGPATGTVRTVERRPVVVDNAVAGGESRDFWNGTERRVPTTGVVYAPNYNEYDSAPVTRLEPWALVNRFDERTLAVSPDTFVDGRRVSLVAFDGNRSTGRVGALPVTVEPTSAPTRTVSVTAGDDPITVSVPTAIPEDTWTELLAPEYDGSDEPTNDRYVDDYGCANPAPDPCGRLTVTLEANATYDLRLGEVGIAADATDERAAYLTAVEGDDATVRESSRQRLVVEARDRFDNPVSGVLVNGTVTAENGDTADAGRLRRTNATTDADGRASFVYEAPANVEGVANATVTLRFGPGEAPRRAVTMSLQAVGPVAVGNGTDGTGTGDEQGGGGEATGTAPTVQFDGVERKARGNGRVDEYDVDVATADADGDLSRVEFELRSLDGTALDDTSETVAGDAASTTGSLRVEGSRIRGEYRVVVTVVDGAGNTDTIERTVAGSG